LLITLRLKRSRPVARGLPALALAETIDGRPRGRPSRI